MSGTNRRPQSELYREVATRWADLDAAARLLEETKTAVFSQKVKELLRDFPHYSLSKAEQSIKGSDYWNEYLEKMVRTRTLANKAKIEVEYVRMKHWEEAQDRADERFTARMS